MTLNIYILSLCFFKSPILIKPIANKNIDNKNILQLTQNSIYKPRIANLYNSFDINSNDKYYKYIYKIKDKNYKFVIKKNNIIRIKNGLLIFIWFMLSAKYNICNKQRLNMLNLPWLHSTCSLGTGALISVIVWKANIHKPPNINLQEIKKYIVCSFFHSIGHISAVIAVSAGAVSFTQIVKSAEPLFACGFNWILLGDKITLPIILSLLPIIFGVSLASISEINFTWTSFIGSMISNIAFAGRNVSSKLAMNKSKNNTITPTNLFSLLTIIGFIISIPLTIFFEGPKILPILSQNTIPYYIILKKSMETGFYFYFYNEAAMILLKNINPVSHAIINTIKRIILLIFCVIFFNTKLTINGVIGSTIAISGSYLYSKTKNIKK